MDLAYVLDLYGDDLQSELEFRSVVPGENKFGRTPLQVAVAYNRISYTEILISRNADTSVLSADGTNLLGLAAFHKHANMINFLLKYTNVDPYLKSNGGKSAVDLYPGIKRKLKTITNQKESLVSN